MSCSMILPGMCNFPVEYMTELDKVWPTGNDRIGLGLIGNEATPYEADLNRYFYYWVEGNPEEGIPGEYESLEQIHSGDLTYTIRDWGFRIYGWSSDIIPNKMFNFYNGFTQERYVQMLLRMCRYIILPGILMKRAKAMSPEHGLR